MPFFSGTARMAGDYTNLHAAAARTANGSGPSASCGIRTAARLTLNVTAVSGTTPSLTVTVETSADGTTWSPVGAFTAATTPGTQRKVFAGLDEYVRVSWAITGTTPSVTFAVDGALV